MKTLIYICAILLITFGGFIFGLKKGAERGQENQQIKEIIKIVKVTDTVKIPEPIPYLVENTDTVYVEVVKDADEPLKVPLIKQRVTYADSTYKAVVSGYNPKLEYIETYNRTHYIIEKVHEKPKKWHLEIYADVKFYERVYMPIGGKLTYRSNRWEFSGKVGKDIITNKVIVEAGANLDLIRF